MKKGFCQSTKGLKKQFDADIGDVVPVVKAEIVYRGKPGQEPRELMQEVGAFYETEVATMDMNEYNELREGYQGNISPEYRERLLAVARAMVQALETPDEQ